jgi:hypothetical protein
MQMLVDAGPDKIVQMLKDAGIDGSRAQAVQWTATATTLIKVA